MSIETLTQQVLDLTNQTTSLLAKIHAQSKYINQAVSSAINAVQSKIVTVERTITSLGSGAAVEFDLTTATLEFSSPMSIVYGYSVNSPTENAHHVEFLVRGATDTVVHDGVAAPGKYLHGQPFTAIKDAEGDLVILRVTNLGSGAITNFNIKLYVMDVEPDFINVMKRPIMITEHTINTLANGVSRDTDINVPSLQFSEKMTMVMAVTATAPVGSRYSIQLLTIDSLNSESPAYITSILEGNLKDTVPFAVVKESLTDRVVLRVMNNNNTPLSGLEIKIYSMGVA